ncbi:MAG: MerR family transcriptional regulator [Burkholderiaceae bacterium]|jgi:chaperone modulatory protein CbpM|nr:MerR family transcriptional regulator [Burkholderiaceae bacterium]
MTAPAVPMTELLDEAALGLHEFARCACLAPEWVLTHVQAGVLQPASGASAAQWRFASATVLRARRIAELEHIYDADPQLAALAADLIEEVAALRRALESLQI